jgi:large subunit ribosomal protein L23
MKKDPQDIILRPIITEKSMAAAREKKFTFEVNPDAGKIEIGQAVEALFPGTKVQKVNTMNYKGKKKTMGRHSGYRSDWKKAIVTLAADSKGIEFFETML